MLYYNEIFSNYEEFKELFGFREFEDGRKCRKNKIQLALIKQPDFLKTISKSKKPHYDYRCFAEDPMNLRHIKFYIYVALRDKCGDALEVPFSPCDRIRSKAYSFDEYQGICQDGIPGYVRVILKDGNVRKVKAGKFISSVIEESFVAFLPQQVKTWFCEEFCSDWRAHETTNMYTLYTSDYSSDFARIYDSDECIGDFHSCMVNEGFESFYSNCVDATAAWLENGDGMIVARCIIFNEVKEVCSSNRYRLAERQYSSDGSEDLKRQLINKLIEGGYIDGYKAIGAGCSEASAFVDTEGQSLSHKSFYIDADIEEDDKVSYQDSFKWYDYEDKRAYNYEISGYTAELSTTSGYIEFQDRVWSEQLGEYILEEEAAYCEDIEGYIYSSRAVYIERHDYYLTEERAVYCEDTRQHEDMDDCFCLDSGEWVYYEENINYCTQCESSFYEDYHTLEEEDEVTGEVVSFCCRGCEENYRYENPKKEEENEQEAA